MILCSRNAQYKDVIKLKEVLAIQSAEQQDTSSALPAAVYLTVVRGHNLAAVKLRITRCIFKKKGHRRVFLLKLELCQNDLQDIPRGCFTCGICQGEELPCISSPLLDLKGSSSIQAPRARRWLWVSHRLQSFSQSKTGKTRLGFYTWLRFVSRAAATANRTPAWSGGSCCEDTSANQKPCN